MAKAATRSTEQEITFKKAFSSFSVDDVNKAKEFYGGTLGVEVGEETEGLVLRFKDGQNVFIYPKSNHEPASFTVLNFPVHDIASAVGRLTEKGIRFESFGGEIETDENGIFWGKRDQGNGPNIAWFKDPAGNFLSVIEN